MWKAADRLEPLPGAFIKLVTLLGARKNEIAGMCRSEFDDPDDPKVWTVPHERTKSRKKVTVKRVYIIPLPPLAQRIIKSLPRLDSDCVFPGRFRGKTLEPGTRLKMSVQEKSGVKDWSYHASRHTLATWLQNQGHSEYERGLALNHSGGGTVTSGYSHGYPLALKRDLLEAWADHVAGLVQPEGVALLT